MKLAKGFSIKGDQDRAFELTEKYVSGMNYRIENRTKPDLLVLKRGGMFGSLFGGKVEDVKTTLTISFSQKGADVIVLCDYDVTGYGVIFTSSDKSTLEGEVEKLKNFLLTAI